mgnify:CR=1 FL=1
MGCWDHGNASSGSKILTRPGWETRRERRRTRWGQKVWGIRRNNLRGNHRGNHRRRWNSHRNSKQSNLLLGLLSEQIQVRGQAKSRGITPSVKSSTLLSKLGITLIHEVGKAGKAGIGAAHRLPQRCPNLLPFPLVCVRRGDRGVNSRSSSSREETGRSLEVKSRWGGRKIGRSQVMMTRWSGRDTGQSEPTWDRHVKSADCVRNVRTEDQRRFPMELSSKLCL